MTITLKNKDLEKLINTLDMAPLGDISYRVESMQVIKLLATRLEQVEDRLEQVFNLYAKATGATRTS